MSRRGSGADKFSERAGDGAMSSMTAGAVTRRSAIAVLTGLSILSTRDALRRANLEIAPVEPDGPTPSLGELAARKGLLFGASIAREGVEIADYRRLYEEHARILTSDIALKFAALRPTDGGPRYEGADQLIEFATANRMAFRGHALIWNENNPAWVKGLNASEIGALLDRHIDATVGRYAGRIHSWDVVNEPFWPDHRAPGFFRKGPWFDALGPAYVARALKRAAAADPKAKLVINEAFTERGDGLGRTVRRELLRLIDTLQHAGAPLHAVGIESHLQPQFPADDVSFTVFLDEIARRGLDIYLTELDVDDISFSEDIRERDQMVADRVFDYLTRAFACPAVKILECWQLADPYSWYADPGVARSRRGGSPSRPLPFDNKLTRKPMFNAIARAIEARDARSAA